MTNVLSDWSLVPVTLAACEALLKKHNNHRLYYFLAIGEGKLRQWLILPQQRITTLFQGWYNEDATRVNARLDSESGFRAFMSPEQCARHRNLLVDLHEGKLILRSGKRKITPLD